MPVVSWINPDFKQEHTVNYSYTLQTVSEAALNMNPTLQIIMEQMKKTETKVGSNMSASQDKVKNSTSTPDEVRKNNNRYQTKSWGASLELSSSSPQNLQQEFNSNPQVTQQDTEMTQHDLEAEQQGSENGWWQLWGWQQW